MYPVLPLLLILAAIPRYLIESGRIGYWDVEIKGSWDVEIKGSWDDVGIFRGCLSVRTSKLPHLHDVLLPDQLLPLCSS